MTKIITEIDTSIIGKEIILQGLAVDCKGGACLKLENDVIYIENLDSWEDKYFKKIITIKGIPVKKKIIPDPHVDADGAISQGALGIQTVLTNHSDIKIVS